ncbi:hypothetical protein P3S68_007226 [Capsicum galapagoense]
MSGTPLKILLPKLSVQFPLTRSKTHTWPVSIGCQPDRNIEPMRVFPMFKFELEELSKPPGHERKEFALACKLLALYLIMLYLTRCNGCNVKSPCYRCKHAMYLQPVSCSWR